MQVAVTFRNIEATDALRRHAESKVQRVRKFLRRPVEAHVVLSVIKHRHVAEITVAANRMTINATEETGDLYSAIDLAMSKIERQVKKRVSKRQSRKHEVAPAVPATPVRRPRIKAERVAVKPMSVSEAVLQLKASGEDFLFFQNTANDMLSLLHRRKIGTYGLIEPEVV